MVILIASIPFYFTVDLFILGLGLLLDFLALQLDLQLELWVMPEYVVPLSSPVYS